MTSFSFEYTGAASIVMGLPEALDRTTTPELTLPVRATLKYSRSVTDIPLSFPLLQSANTVPCISMTAMLSNSSPTSALILASLCWRASIFSEDLVTPSLATLAVVSMRRLPIEISLRRLISWLKELWIESARFFAVSAVRLMLAFSSSLDDFIVAIEPTQTVETSTIKVPPSNSFQESFNFFIFPPFVP